MSSLEKSTLWIVGDSTVSSFNDDIYMPRFGWGAVLGEFFEKELQINNLAISGTSSKSFRNTDNYKQFAQGISKGDYLMIGFGHNDEKTGGVTFTDGNGDWTVEGSFAHSLYNYYIKVAEDAGATAILVTPIPRRDTSMRYKADFVHQTVHGDYAKSIVELGKDKNVVVCNLTKEITELILKVDVDDDPDNDSLYQHARTGSHPACTDDTHTSLFGAMVNAYQIVVDLKEQKSELAKYIKDNIENPLSKASFWKDKSISKTYVDPVYVRPEGFSDFWPDYKDASGNIWHATVFGDIFGKGPKSTESFFLGAGEDGNMCIRAGINANNGKIAQTSDGIAMYFMRLPVKEQFELSADVRLDSFNSAGQAAEYAAYGLMVRDDMYIDEVNGNLMGDYVVGGVLFRSETPIGSNTFARKNYVNVYEGGQLDHTPVPGETMRMMVKSTLDGYVAQVGDNDPVIAGYDFALTRVDSDYVYIGFFAARSLSITVSNISLTLK